MRGGIPQLENAVSRLRQNLSAGRDEDRPHGYFAAPGSFSGFGEGRFQMGFVGGGWACHGDCPESTPRSAPL
jgi:hypothetical protein